MSSRDLRVALLGAVLGLGTIGRHEEGPAGEAVSAAAASGDTVRL